MKNFTLFPMQSYKGKFFGAGIALLSMILMLISANSENFTFFGGFDSSQHFQVFLWLSIFGFSLIANSKEKIDDERVKIIRAKALHSAFSILIATIMGVGFTGIRYPNFSINAGEDLSIFAAIGITVYLVVFYIAYFFDSNWMYNDDTTMENIKKNKTFFIVYASISIALVVIIIILR